MTTAVNRDEGKLLARVALLLEQAEGFRRHGDDGSADAALALAEKMMMKYSFDAADVDAARRVRGEPSEQIVRVVLNFTGIYRQVLLTSAYRYLLALGTLRGVEARNHRVKGTDELWVIGFESDVEHARLLVASLQVQCLAALERWWRGVSDSLSYLTPMEKFKERREFVAQFSRAAAERVRVARETALGRDVTPGTVVAVRDRKTLVDEFLDLNFDLTTGRVGRWLGGSGNATVAGLNAGRAAVTGETQVGVTRRSIERSR